MNKEQTLKIIKLVTDLFYLVDDERKETRGFCEKTAQGYLGIMNEICDKMSSSDSIESDEFSKLATAFRKLSDELKEVEDFNMSLLEGDKKVLEVFNAFLNIVKDLQPSNVEEDFKNTVFS